MKPFPLQWPQALPRRPEHQRVQRAPYKADFVQAYEEALRALKLLGAVGAVISTDAPPRRDGKPYADSDPQDPGVAVYFTHKNRAHVIACDRFDRLRFNMRAVGLALEGLRAIERTGATELLDRALGGFAALPSGAGSAPAKRPWREVLNLDGFKAPGFVMKAGIEAAYKELAKARHPDRGGSEAAMTELNVARDEGLQEAARS
jgi:hypothetical protein